MDNLITIAAVALGLSGSPAIPTNFRHQFEIVRFCPTFFSMDVVIGHCKKQTAGMVVHLKMTAAR